VQTIAVVQQVCGISPGKIKKNNACANKKVPMRARDVIKSTGNNHAIDTTFEFATANCTVAN